MIDEQSKPHIHVFGEITIWHDTQNVDVLTGSSRTLMALLVAAGAQGVALEEMAAAFWPTERPALWQPAVQHAIARLQRRMPDSWCIHEVDGLFSLDVAAGWVDAWRLESLVDDVDLHEVDLHEDDLHKVDLHKDDLAWILAGPAYDGILPTGPIAASKRRLHAMQHDIATRHRRLARPVSAATEIPSIDLGDPKSTLPVGYRSRKHAAAELRLRSANRALLLGPALSGKSETLNRVAGAKSGLESHVVLGDPNLTLQLGAFASAFPSLRDTLLDSTGSNARSVAAGAWRVIVEHLAERAKQRPQRILIDDADALDPTSLILATMLFQYEAPETFRIVASADQASTNLKWTDFVVTAERDGVEIVTVPLVVDDTPTTDWSWLDQPISSKPTNANLKICV